MRAIAMQQAEIIDTYCFFDTFCVWGHEVKIFSHSLIGLLALLGLTLSGVFAPATLANERLNPQSKEGAPVGEFFMGGAFTTSSWISWAGAVKSLSSSLYDEGWRMRVLGAYGRYSFSTDGQPNSANPALFEITPGYQFKTGPVISKIYGGLHGEQHKLANPDPDNKTAGMGYGAKVILENWIDLPMNSFASLDGSFSTLNTSYQGTLRAGSAYYFPQLTLGPEVQIVGNEEYYQLRAGLFGRWKLETGSIKASIGYAEDYDQQSTPYISFSWLRRF